MINANANAEFILHILYKNKLKIITRPTILSEKYYDK